MLTFLVRPVIVGVFDRISRRDIDGVVNGLAVDVHHRFAGQHALGGERHTRDAVRLWFERLFRLYPSLTFEVQRVTCSGWPWALDVAVEWIAHATPVHGEPYVNTGAHLIRLRGARVSHLHAYEDSQAVVRALEIMTAAGVTEASAEPIGDAPVGW